MNKNKMTMDILEKLSIKVTRGAYPGIEVKSVASNQVQSTQIFAPQVPKNDTKLLVVFTGSNLGFEESLSEAKKLKDLGYTIDVAISESAESMFGEERFRSLNPRSLYTAKDKMNYLEMVQNVDAVVVPIATQNTAIKLSLGLQDSFISMLLWQSLWQGKTLFMNMDDMTTHRGMEAKSKMLLQMMSGYVDKLKRLGVKPISTLNLSKSIHESFTSEKNSSIKFEGAIERPVITEKDILKRAAGDTITVPLRAIITSLAQEAAKNLSINIVRQNG
ncbi:flavoprotein [Clostridium cylindrosporum]|uniref:Flavoprotein n=1 Tax=Clostridium cylindrosporum DSM 605 TaxID=1121307 RepID=A0A0J8DCX4_CLOCY|nr:flavoprotein [Clostridium cylindrosporum]KMT22103.1 flavoprotein [Clostridium cylindrosporum DSM 605]